MLSIKNWEEYTYYLGMYLKNDNVHQFRFDFFQLHTNNQIDFFNTLNDLQRKPFYNVVKPDEFAAIFSKLEPVRQLAIVEELKESYAVAMLMDLPTDEMTDFLHALPKEMIEHYLGFMDKKDAHQMKVLLSYNPDTAGAMMTTEYVTALRNESVSSILKRLKVLGKDAESIYYIYIVNAVNQLIGVVSLREVIMTEKDSDTMKSIMKEQVVSVKPYTDQEKVIQLIKDYDLLLIPVVSEKNELLGIVTVDDAMDVYNEETNEDFGEMAAVKGAIDLDISALRATKVRLPWLIALLLIGLIPAAIIANTHHLLKEMALISIFTPLIAGMAGNTGTQSLAVVLRGLAEGKLNRQSFRKLLRREAVTALLMAVVCGILAGLIGWVLAEKHAVMGVIVGISMFLSIFICTLTGTLIPYTIYKFKIDPAVASGPFITTINDIVAIGIYFSAASILFIYI